MAAFNIEDRLDAVFIGAHHLINLRGHSQRLLNGFLKVFSKNLCATSVRV